MSERLQTVFVRRTTAKRRITNIASRFSRVLTDDNAYQTVHDLRIDMRNALETFPAVDDQLRSLSEAAEANALPTELATAVYAGDVPAVNTLFRNRGSGNGSTEYKNPSSEGQLCWYHLKFRDQAR